MEDVSSMLILHVVRLHCTNKSLTVARYGPVEATVMSTVHEFSASHSHGDNVSPNDTHADSQQEKRQKQQGRKTPIGRALPRVRVHILDGCLHPVAPGDIGEVSGDPVASPVIHFHSLDMCSGYERIEGLYWQTRAVSR